ncbi:hypothetical protein BH10PSE2_BH10PSE2_15230 [soil metagenome]
MRLAATLAVLATVATAACAADPMGPGGPPPTPPMADDGNDCAVIAAVAKEHYHFNATDHLPPPLWLHDGGRAWSPRCDWGRYGLSFPTTFEPDATRRAGERVQWVSFERPVYDGRGATVASGILFGPLAGNGIECRVVSGFAGWTVSECKNTWIS